MTPTLQDVAKFLLGEGPLDGVWYGEPNPAAVGNFWWRKHLRSALAQQGEPVAWMIWLHGPAGLFEHKQLAELEFQRRNNLYPDSNRKLLPLCAGAAPAAQPDARKVIEQMVEALDNTIPTNWSNESVDERAAAIQAGQKWLEENK